MSPVILLLYVYASLFDQEKFIVAEDLRDRWMTSAQGEYAPADKDALHGKQTVYFSLGRSEYADGQLRIASHNPYFLFLNGKIAGRFTGSKIFRLDSLRQLDRSPTHTFAIHQERINRRDLVAEVIVAAPTAVARDVPVARPYLFSRDFVVVAGMIIILFFVFISRFNPKLTADYFSPARVISQRDTDDSQASARLTSGANVQFYILCALLLAFYLVIIFHNLPSHYALPAHFQADSFWSMMGQWLKLSSLIFAVLLAKILVVFALTRLFDMRGLARIHYFNFIRVLLLVFGALSVVLFAYYMGRGDSPVVFAVFLVLVVVALILWVVLGFFKLSGRTGHSLFHLFSYLCATEIIPLLVTAKVLLQ